MNYAQRILWRAAQLLDNYPTMGPHISVEIALQKAHREVHKFWGYLPIAKMAVIDQLHTEGYTIPVEQWLHYAGAEARTLVPVLRKAAHSSE